MAVTFHTQPRGYTPSDNPVVWTFSSDMTAEDNFVYIVKVYINDVLVANDFVYPDNGIYARYDASNRTSSACGTPAISDDLFVDANNYCRVRITVVEKYGTPPVEEASNSASNITCFKARMNNDDFVDWFTNSNNYIYGIPGRFLTNHPDFQKVRLDEQMRLLIINNLNTLTDFKYELFDADGVSIASTTTTYVATSSRLVMCNVSPEAIIAGTSLTLANFEASSYMEVSAASLAGILAHRIDIDKELVYSTYQRLHYLSNWGSIESFSFGLISRESGQVESFGYRSVFGEWDGEDYVFNKTQGLDMDYAKSAKKSLKLTSNWIGQDLQNYLCDNLYVSPLIYQERGDLMTRRKITSKTYDKKIHENDVIFLEEVTIALPTYNSMTV